MRDAIYRLKIQNMRDYFPRDAILSASKVPSFSARCGFKGPMQPYFMASFSARSSRHLSKFVKNQKIHKIRFKLNLYENIKKFINYKNSKNYKICDIISKLIF